MASGLSPITVRSSQSSNWQLLVKEGEIVVIGTSGGGGHITTCVSGSGSTAMLVDNATFVSANGQVQNLANDGSSSDIIIAARTRRIPGMGRSFRFIGRDL